MRKRNLNAEKEIIDALTRRPEGLTRRALLAVTELHKSTVSQALTRLKKRQVLVSISKRNIGGKVEEIYRLRTSPLQQWARENASLDRHEKKMSRKNRALLHVLVGDHEYVRIATLYQVYKAVMSGDETLEVFRDQVTGAWGKSPSEAIERLVKSIEETGRAETSWAKPLGIPQEQLLLPRPLIRQAIMEAMKEGKIRIQNLAFIAPSHGLDQVIQTFERDLHLRIDNTKRRLNGEHEELLQEPVAVSDSQKVIDFTSNVLEMIDDVTTQAINLENHEMSKRLRTIYREGQILTRLYGEEMASLYLSKFRQLVNAHWALFSKMLRSRSELLRKIMQEDNLPREAWLKELDAGRGMPISKTGAVPLT